MGGRAGKRQARTPSKTDGWGKRLRGLLPVALERRAGAFGGFEGGQTGGSNAFKTDGWGMWLRELLPVAKLAGGFAGLRHFRRAKGCGSVWTAEGGQTAGSNALKNRWLGHVAARVCESCQLPGLPERLESLRACKCGCESCCQLLWQSLRDGQTAGSNALKNRWLGHVAARVVASCVGKACGRV